MSNWRLHEWNFLRTVENHRSYSDTLYNWDKNLSMRIQGMYPNGRCVNLCYNCYKLCPRLLTHLRIYQTSCVSTSCSDCLWASIVRTRPLFTIRLLLISNFARPLRNIFSAAGSGISVLYGKTVYCKRSTIFVPRIFCPLYTMNSPWKTPCKNIRGCENAVKKKFFSIVFISIIA